MSFLEVGLIVFRINYLLSMLLILSALACSGMNTLVGIHQAIKGQFAGIWAPAFRLACSIGALGTTLLMLRVALSILDQESDVHEKFVRLIVWDIFQVIALLIQINFLFFLMARTVQEWRRGSRLIALKEEASPRQQDRQNPFEAPKK